MTSQQSRTINTFRVATFAARCAVPTASLPTSPVAITIALTLLIVLDISPSVLFAIMT